MSEVPGQVNLTCDHVTGAKLYIWHAGSDPVVEANWHQVGTDSKCKFSAGGLTSGAKNWFRVAALGTGTGNQSLWSDPALKMAP